MKKSVTLIAFLCLIATYGYAINYTKVSADREFSPDYDISLTAKQFATMCMSKSDTLEYKFCLAIFIWYTKASDSANEYYQLGIRTAKKVYDPYNAKYSFFKDDRIGYYPPSTVEFGCVSDDTPTNLAVAYVTWLKQNPRAENLEYGSTIKSAMMDSYSACLHKMK